MTEGDGSSHQLPTLEQFQLSGDEYELTYEEYKTIANEYRRRTGFKEISRVSPTGTEMK